MVTKQKELLILITSLLQQEVNIIIKSSIISSMKNTSSTHFSRKRGSIVLFALIMLTAIGLYIASTLRNSVQEGRLNERHFTTIQANNAAESVVEYGTSQLIRRWRSQTIFRANELGPNSKPLQLHGEALDFFKRQDLPITNIALQGGIIPPNARFYVDPNDHDNKHDPHKGKNVFARNIEIYGRATATHPITGAHTSYAMQVFQLRDAPLISHAIFYNMDLEFHPGPDMDIMGPVHTNGDLYVLSENNLYFHGVVTAAGEFRVGRKKSDQWPNWTTNHTAKKVWFKDNADNWQNVYKGTGNDRQSASYYQSTSDFTSNSTWKDWRTYTDNKLGGSVLSKAHGVYVLNPVGYDNYVRDETADGQDKTYNPSYALIEPNLKFDDPRYKGVGEEEKFARKAGLIAKIYQAGVDTIPSHAARIRKRPNPDDSWANGTLNYLTDTNVTSSTLTGQNTDYYVAFYSLKRTDATEPNSELVVNERFVPKIDPVTGETISVRHTEVIEEPVLFNASFDRLGTTPGNKPSGNDANARFNNATAAQKLRKQFDDMIAAHPYTQNSSGTTTGGIRDYRVELTKPRSESSISVIEINTAALANILEVGNHQLFSNYTPQNQYNGALYVEFPKNNAYTPRADNLHVAKENLALLLTQGGGTDMTKGRVPDPAYNKNVELRDEGFTLVTNAPLYVKGHFNADGNMNTPSATDYNNSDNPASPRPPVALVADAITILSSSWNISGVNTKNPAAADTEVAAALVTGISPTNKNGVSVASGGSHNFPRFLENWSGKKFRYRGALVGLFESEIQSEPLERADGSAGHYSPPNRQWGFYTPFAEGNFPPIMPNVRDYKKLDFRFLTKKEYEDKLDALPW